MTLTPAEVQFLADALQTFKRNRLTDARKVPSAASELHAAAEIQRNIAGVKVTLRWVRSQTEHAWTDADRKARIKALRGYVTKLESDLCDALPEGRSYSNL